MHVRELVERFTHGVPDAADADARMAGARAVLESLAGDIDALADAMAYIPGIGGNARQAFYRAPDLSLLKVAFPDGRRTPPHDHGTWAAILVLSGAEKNTLYRRGDDGQLRRVSEVVLEPGSVITLRRDTVHVAEGLGDTPTIGLHVYGADVLATERYMWDPDTLEAQPLDWGRYEDLARRATAAAGAPLGA